MSDKDVEKFVRENADFGPLSESDVSAIARLIVKFAVECAAPAPQPSELQIWASRARAARQQWLESYGVPISNEFAQFAEAIGNLINLAEAAATPQITPCDHFWRTIPVGPRWSWFTECEKCKIGAPLKLQAENYVEGTSEQASKGTK